MTESESLRLERLSLLIGTMIGQISELLNYMKRDNANLNASYKGLLDISEMASLQIHEVYYKEDKKDIK